MACMVIVLGIAVGEPETCSARLMPPSSLRLNKSSPVAAFTSYGLRKMVPFSTITVRRDIAGIAGLRRGAGFHDHGDLRMPPSNPALAWLASYPAEVSRSGNVCNTPVPARQVACRQSPPR